MDNLFMDNPMKIPYDRPLPVDTLRSAAWTSQGVQVDVLRLDTIHPVISGNKWFKLKEYLRQALHDRKERIVTFGGAWSNHIVATAYAARAAGLRSAGIIRGERADPLSDTLEAALDYGMQLEFISRAAYKNRAEASFLAELSSRWPGACFIPEGGAGRSGITGSATILEELDPTPYSHILCAIGTGATYWGLANGAAPGQQIIGIPVLKGMDGFLQQGREWLQDPSRLSFCHIEPAYHFGGYARRTEELLAFMNELYRETGIPSDFVYTGKLFYAARDLLSKSYFPPGSQLLLIHSGGLQGNRSLPAGILDF